MSTTTNGAEYPYLERRAGSSYRQLFVKGTRIRAEILYDLTIPKEDGFVMTPEEIAADFRIPVEAVRDAVRYCESDPVEIRMDHRAADLLFEAMGANDPDYATNPAKHRGVLPLGTRRRIDEQIEREFGRR
ncbi:MAG: hypothetical protein U0746_03545 [Gemmataceae bacterium]